MHIIKAMKTLQSRYTDLQKDKNSKKIKIKGKDGTGQDKTGRMKITADTNLFTFLSGEAIYYPRLAIWIRFLYVFRNFINNHLTNR